MRRMIALVVIVSALWGVYWFVAASGLKSAINTQFSQLRTMGWSLEYDSLSVQGFPSRLDTRVQNLELTAPRNAFKWQAPFFQVFALSYRPNHVIAVWPDAFAVETTAGAYDVTHQDLRASLRLEASTDLALEQLVIVGQDLRFDSADVGQASVQATQLSVRPLPARPGYYESALELDEIVPMASLAAQLGWASETPLTISRAFVNGEFRFDAPLDRTALTDGPLQLQEATVTRAHLRIADTVLNLSGELRISRFAPPEGKVQLNATGWKALLAQLDPAKLDTETLTKRLTAMVGEDEEIALNLTLREGFIHFGPIPLIPAPDWRLP